MQAFNGMIDFSADLSDFGETAALIQNLDLVISVDTSMGHLAGAMAKPVWIMVPKAADWRWQLEREDSPWYPTARLFRQARPGEWDPVLARLTAALAGELRQQAAAD
jgi:ADP-heptose:LPS heptosyltransferase